jgi:hypothetical protein
MPVFKTTNVPEKNANETREVAAPDPGKQINASRISGERLPASSTDTVDHPPSIPWPPADPTGVGDTHKPFKNTKGTK